jgi:hypothetical protein
MAIWVREPAGDRFIVVASRQSQSEPCRRRKRLGMSEGKTFPLLCHEADRWVPAVCITLQTNDNPQGDGCTKVALNLRVHRRWGPGATHSDRNHSSRAAEKARATIQLLPGTALVSEPFGGDDEVIAEVADCFCAGLFVPCIDDHAGLWIHRP